MEMRARFSLGLLLITCFLLQAHSRPSPVATLRQQTSIHQFLTPHNTERRKLGIPPLRWSKKLAQFAATWAHKRREDCELVHSGGDYGENLFWGSWKEWKPRDAVAAWTEEKRSYDSGRNRCVEEEECLHYTQIIWRETTRVGCASVAVRTETLLFLVLTIPTVMSLVRGLFDACKL